MGVNADRRWKDGGLWGPFRQYLTPYECRESASGVEEALVKGKKTS